MAWLIDLSLSLGQPAHLLAQMPLPWLMLYQQYSQEHGLPHWRQELQLARINMSLDALRIPVEHLQLDQYLVRPQRQQEQASEAAPQLPTEQEADAICAALGVRI